MNKFTLITGASGGIGKELAKIAAREKQNLLLVARSEKRLKEVGKEIRQQTQDESLQIELLALDLSKPTAPKQVFEFCRKNQLFIDTLVNNAGFGDYGVFSASTLGRQLEMIDLNISTLTALTHLFLPEMIKQSSGKIMNLGSVASFLPGPLMSTYFATKNYVLSFSRALSEELRDTGVSVTCLCPGPTKSGFGSTARVSKTHSTSNPKTTAREVAEYGWYQMQNGTPVAIYGFSNRMMIQLVKFVPRDLVARLVKKVQR